VQVQLTTSGQNMLGSLVCNVCSQDVLPFFSFFNNHGDTNITMHFHQFGDVKLGFLPKQAQLSFQQV